MRRDRKMIGVLSLLAVAQICGWGTLDLPAVIGHQIAADLHMSLAAVFAGSSVLFVVMGFWAPVLSRLFVRYGARHVMIVGSALAAPGFAMLALAKGSFLYFASWVVLGTAGSATLTAAAHIMLNELAGRDAKSAIGALMLATGVASSIFWPTTAFLSERLGWRATCLCYAAAMICVCLPIYSFGLPRRARATDAAAPSLTFSTEQVARKSTFYLVAAGIALNAFVTFGFSAVLLELLRAEGLTPAEAIAFGSTLGVIQISARAIDTLGGGRWDGLTTGLFAEVALPLAMVVLIAGRGAHWSVGAFILIYGMGSGALAVARATIPLVFYDKASYAMVYSRISLPINLSAALAPPVLAGLLTTFGADAVLGLTMMLTTCTFLIFVVLGRRRPPRVLAPKLE